jgi:hypothetical protein
LFKFKVEGATSEK